MVTYSVESVVSCMNFNGEGRTVDKVNEFELEYRNGDSGPKYLFRGPKIEWGVIAFMPGQSLGKHYHQEVEENFISLKVCLS